MNRVVSAKPARLVRFERTGVELASGIRRRGGRMEQALKEYARTCEVSEMVDLGPVRFTESSAHEAIHAWCSNLDAVAHWTGRVGRAFTSAGARANYMHPGSQFYDGIVELSDDEVDGQFDPGSDPYFGYTDIGERDHSGKPPEPDDPAFQDFLEKGGMVLTGVEAAGPKRLVLQHLPGVTRVQAGAFERWLGKAGLAAHFLIAGRSEWYADHDYAGSERAQRAAITGGIVALSGWMGGTVGAAVGAPVSVLCGPAAPACEGGFIFGGAVLGAKLGESVAGSINQSTGHEPAEHAYDKLGDDVGDDTFPGRDDSFPANADQAAAQVAQARAQAAGDSALQRAIAARHPTPQPTPGPAPVPPR